MWVSHVLRREAERLILANLEEFSRGEYQPQDIDDYDALLGACQFTNRPLTAARLYAGAFAAAPSLVENIHFDHRHHAACSAALAGSGRGEDEERIGEPERSRWRAQAREWLRADLIACGIVLDGDPGGNRDIIRRRLTLWRDDPDLAGLRDSGELNNLSVDERKDCMALWTEVGDLLDRCENAK